MSTVHYKDEQWFFGGYTNGKRRQIAKLRGCSIELLPTQLPFDGRWISSHVYNLRKVGSKFSDIMGRSYWLFEFCRDHFEEKAMKYCYVLQKG